MKVIELKALRELAADLYSFNTMTIEAQEVQSKMASLRKQHAELTPSGESLQADGLSGPSGTASTALVTSAPVGQPQLGQSLVSAFKESQLIEPDQKEQLQAFSSAQDTDSAEDLASSSSQAEETAEGAVVQEPEEAIDEVAEIANAMWEGAGGDSEADTQTDAEPPRELEGTLVREREAAESVSSDPTTALDGLERLQQEPKQSVSMSPVSATHSERDVTTNGSVRTAVAHSESGVLEMPLKSDEKEEIRQLQQEMQLELHSGMLRFLSSAWTPELYLERSFFQILLHRWCS